MPKENEKLNKDDLYSGKNDGLTFEKFDDHVLSWCREKYGDKYAHALWKDELMKIGTLDLTDDLDRYGFETYCEWMFDILSLESPRYAAELWKSDRFWTKKWQLEQRQRQREKLFCHLEKVTHGEAKRQLVKRGVGHMNTIRKFFFDRFGAGQPEVLAERTKFYMLGMPGKDGEVFPPRCNMENKLDKLETEREFLVEMCPKDKRDTYEEGKEHTLVRIILRNVPAEYDAAVKSVRDMMKLRKFGEDGNFKGFTNKEDHTRVNYDSEWLPPYDELRVELVSSWQQQERRRKDVNKSIRKHPGFPTLPILPGHEQPGPHRRNCYSCGLADHLSGDPVCKAGPNDVWKGAPAGWKNRMGRPKGIRPKGKGGKGKGGKGKGKGMPYQRNLGNREPVDKEKSNDMICHNYSRGNGYCKYGTNCNFKHEGPKGGKRKVPVASIVTQGSAKRAKKKQASLILKDEKLGKGQDNDDDDVYRLLRGAPSFIVTRSAKESEAYRPSWLEKENPVEDGMGYMEPPLSTSFNRYGKRSKETVKFFVTLMIKKGGGEEGYVPDYSSPPPKENSSSSSSSSSSEDSDEDYPPPKFKIGDEVKWKRNVGDSHIHGVGNITKVERHSPDPEGIDLYSYEIDTARETEAGREGHVSESLIRHLSFNELMVDGEEEDYERWRRSRAASPLDHQVAAIQGSSSSNAEAEVPIGPSNRPMKGEHSLEKREIFKRDADWSDLSPPRQESSVDDAVPKSESTNVRDWSKRSLHGIKSEITKSGGSAVNTLLSAPRERMRLAINLTFPGGERESQVYTLSKFLSVKELKERIRLHLLKTNLDISLFVGPDWRPLDHTGIVTDRTEPGTNVPCPYLFQGVMVRVELGANRVSLVGDRKRPVRGGEKSSPQEMTNITEAEGRLRRIKGISTGPVRWFANERGTSDQANDQSPTRTSKNIKRSESMGYIRDKNRARNDQAEESSALRRKEHVDRLRTEGKSLKIKPVNVPTGPRREYVDRLKAIQNSQKPSPGEGKVKHKPAKTRSKQEGSSSVKAKRAEKGKPVSLLDGWDTDPDSDADPDPKRRCRRLTDSAEVFSDRDDLEEDEGDDVMMIIKVKRGGNEAYVDFSFPENRGYTGPFTTGVSVNQLLAYYEQWRVESDSDSSMDNDDDPDREEKEESTSDDDDDGSEKDKEDNHDKVELEGGPKTKSTTIEPRDEEWLFVDEKYLNHGGEKHHGVKTRFKHGQIVYYWDTNKVNYWVGVVKGIQIPVIKREGLIAARYAIEPEGEGNDRVQNVLIQEKNMRPIEWALWCLQQKRVVPITCLPVNATPLLPLDCVGIDTCSALSVSSERSDFPFLDQSQSARDSISLRGIGGEQSAVGGRGPMLISAYDDQGREIYLVDPLGVYLGGSNIKLRILGQQRMKDFGFNLVQNKDGDGKDFLIYRSPGGENGNKASIPLATIDGILMLRTRKLNLTAKNKILVNEYVMSLCKTSAVAERDHLFHFGNEKACSVLIMNEGDLSDRESRRLDHWRYAHRSRTGNRHDERCPACEQAKHKSGSFKRNKEFLGTGIATKTVYWRLYCDGFGGQQSMGQESYQGAKGGFVFVCPVSGTIKVKLYASTKQYAAILYQVLQEVESEGYAVREIYVDTFIVNISKAAEDVAAMFKVRIVPISSGTPQEMAYAERAVQTLAQMSRALMAGAPHLPQFCWGCSDLHSANLHKVLPQKTKDMMSPYEMTTGRAPNLDAMFIKVFGCACQYEPYEGAEHKRAPKTLWGWYLGVQWPMVLILRPSDQKIISVSRKKVHCHELCYAKFDPTTQPRPLIVFTDFSLIESEIDDAIVEAKAMDRKALKKFKADNNIPTHVPSVKSLSDFNRNSILNEDPITSQLPDNMLIDLPQASHLGEGEAQRLDLFESRLNKDDLLEEIEAWKKKITHGYGETLTEKVVKALNQAEEEISNHAPKRGELKRKKRDNNRVKGLETKNIIDEKRNNGTENSLWTKNTKVRDLKIKIGDSVRIATHRFGKEYARGLPKFTFGKVIDIMGESTKVKWEQGDEDIVKHLSLKLPGHKGTTLAAISSSDLPVWDDPRKRRPDLMECGDVSMDDIMELDKDMFDKWEQDIIKFPQEWTVETILPIMEVGSCVSGSELGGSWPRDFYEALIRPDWRRWIEAVKDENESWNTFDACEEVTYDSIQKGASVIPLGELFTIKRNGKYKFRQIALGNLLKEGKDYAETFASTISGDGIRWFYAVASSCSKNIFGWDAKTGYLQTEQRIPIYAYLPSHYGYSNLTFEELASLRAKMIHLLKTEGIEGVKRFSGKMRKERRIRPKTVLKLNRSIYGVPDAGQSFAMFMQSLHIKRCGMVQSELDPCIYYKIMQKDSVDGVEGEPVLMEFLIAITWVDDVRYFGTEKLVKEYETMIQQHCKCTLEGISSEFVSIEITHDVVGKVLEMKQEDYWVKAVDRFREYLGKEGPKSRLVPLSVADEKLLVEPSDAEIAEAQSLPFPSLLGVVQYPSCYTKIEMKYSMSILSRWRTKWGPNHFKVLLKALEYGYATRKRGLRYNGNKGKTIDVNVMEGFADASLSVPRSQGSRSILMNRAAITMTSKRHSTTDDSTTAAELTEAYLLACEIEGFRNLMSEVGLRQNGPTILYQDNKAAIQIAMNRGSLSRKTRGTDLRVLTLRNKVEDLKVVPIYLNTADMLADLGTKALDPKTFCRLCDMLCGYADRVTTVKLEIENYVDETYTPNPKTTSWTDL